MPPFIFGKDPATGQSRINANALAAQQVAPRTPPELGLRLLASGLREKTRREEEAQRNEALAAALSAAQTGTPEFRNPDNPAQVLIPERKPGADALIAALSSANDPQLKSLALSAALQQATQPPQEQFTPLSPEDLKAAGLPEGASAQRSTTTGQIRVLNKPPTVAPTSLERNLTAAGIDPKSPEGQKLIRDSLTKSQVTVNQGTQQTEEDKAFGKSLVANFDAISERANAAEDSIAQLEVARRIPVETGAFTPLKTTIAAFAEASGVDPETLGLESATNAQAFRGVLNNLVLSKMQAQKGPQTENDAKRIEETLANLKNTKDANDFLMRSMIALERRKVEQRDFFLEYKAKNGTFAGARREWNKFKRKTPLVGTNPQSKLPVFFSEYRALVRSANPNASEDEILKLWREKYAG